MSLGVSKERITIRLSPEVVQAFRASGAGSAAFRVGFRWNIAVDRKKHEKTPSGLGWGFGDNRDMSPYFREKKSLANLISSRPTSKTKFCNHVLIGNGL